MIGLGLKAVEAEIAQEADLEGVDGEAAAELYIALIKTVLESTETVDFGLDYRSGELTASASLHALPDSAMDGWSSARPADTMTVARRLRTDSTIAVVGAGDWTAVSEKLQPFFGDLWDLYPEPIRSTIGPIFDSWISLYSLLDPVYAVDATLPGENGLSLRLHFVPDDPQQFATEFDERIRALPFEAFGIQFEGPTRSGECGHSDLRLRPGARRRSAQRHPRRESRTERS